MPTQIRLDISQPCQERWGDMKALPGGRYCAQCEKTVVDLSDKTDDEVISFFLQQEGTVCSRLSPNQLNRPLTYSLSHDSGWKRTAYVLSTLLGISVTGSFAQTQPSTKPVSFIQAETDLVSINPNTNPTSEDSSKYITGQVADSVDNTPLAYAIVSIPNHHIGTLSDSNGYFKIEIPASVKDTEFTVELKMVGYKTKKIPLTLNSDHITYVLNAELESVSMVTGQTIIVRASDNNGKKHRFRRFFRKLFKSPPHNVNTTLNYSAYGFHTTT